MQYTQACMFKPSYMYIETDQYTEAIELIFLGKYNILP